MPLIPLPSPKIARFAVALMTALASSSCSQLAVSGPTTSSSASPALSDPTKVPTVAVANPTFETFSRDAVLTGEFRPYQSVELHAKLAGYLRKINVDIGDHVRAGDLLAILEIPEMDADLAQATAERRRFEAERNRLTAEVERAKAALAMTVLSHDRLAAAAKAEAGIIAQQEIDEAAARRRVAEAQLSTARAALQVIEQQIEASKANEQKIKTLTSYMEIRAPFSGMITKRYADPGAMIQSGTASQSQAMPVVRLSQIHRLRLAVIVPETLAPMVRHGERVEIRVPSLRKSFPGMVSRINHDVQFSSRTMEAEVDVHNPGGELLPGMTAEVVVSLSRKERTLAVPLQALIHSGGNRSVLVVNPAGVVEEREVKTGAESATHAEVTAGLSAGDRIIVGSRSLLKPGQTVMAKLTLPDGQAEGR
jgi:RND family efflux transporter MFP subunit